jgi:hypothetical protein
MLKMSEEEQVITTDFLTKCQILADLWISHRDDPRLQDFIKFHDIGLPLAYMIDNGLVEQNGLGENFVNETFRLLLDEVGIEDDGYCNLEEILDFYSDPVEVQDEEEDGIDPYELGKAVGARQEQERIQEVIKMQKRWAKETRKGSEYIFWDSVGEVLTPVKFEFSEEAYRKSLEDDGF